MPDYQALDLSSIYNAGVEAVVHGRRLRRSASAPTTACPSASASDQARCLLALGGARGARQGHRTGPASSARHVIFAHRLLESDLEPRRHGRQARSPPTRSSSRTVGASSSRSASDSRSRRRRCRGAGCRSGPGPTRRTRLIDRDAGRWEQAGRRQTEVDQATAGLVVADRHRQPGARGRDRVDRDRAGRPGLRARGDHAQARRRGPVPAPGRIARSRSP